MRVATTFDSGELSPHFGHTPYFKIFVVDDAENEVTGTELLSTEGHGGHLALTQLLHDHNVQVVICGGLGAPAIGSIRAAGIELYPGITGSAEEAVRSFIAGELPQHDPQTAVIACCHHEGEEHHH